MGTINNRIQGDDEQEVGRDTKTPTENELVDPGNRPHSEHNKIQASGGGSINISNLAQGDKPRAEMTVYRATQSEQESRQEIHKKLAELEKSLDTHASSLQNAEEIRNSTATIADELKKTQPDKNALTKTLNSIAEGVKSIAGITTAVEALKHAITPFL